MSLIAAMMCCASSAKTYVEDVFSTYLYTGNGSTQTINNGIDLAGKGGLVWEKNRSVSQDHYLVDSNRPLSDVLRTNTTGTPSSPWGGYLFGANGYTSGINFANGNSIASWTFRNAPKFFKCATVVKSAGSNATVDLSSLGTVGMVTVKRTDSTGDWYTWHRSLPAGQLVYINQTAAAATLGHITVSGTTLTLVNGVIVDGTYVVYAWAHDTSADGIVQCGSFTNNANTAVTLGWEPQWILVKDTTHNANQWQIYDTVRGNSLSASAALLPASSSAETAYSASYYPTSTGFLCTNKVGSTGANMIYLAIRRGPMKTPTSGASVFAPTAMSGTYAANTNYVTTGFPVDLTIDQYSLSGASQNYASTRLTNTTLGTQVTSAESNAYGHSFKSNTGMQRTSSYNTNNTVNWSLQRAPGFFDVVCYTGTGVARTVPHGLGVTPELMIVKNRGNSGNWAIYVASTWPACGYLNSNATFTSTSLPSIWFNNAQPSATAFTVNNVQDTNKLNNNYVACLFATLPGISKVGSYTGNGSSQNIECGFTTGARFILVKRTDAAGDWYVWDAARGIVAANDPHLSLNTTAAEVTTDDSIDPYSAGFTVNQNAATNINVSAATYIFLAIS